MRNRIPKTFFVTQGSGDSDNQVHAGSYHIALHEAGISDYNIMTYSSVLPACAEKVDRKEAKYPAFGSELMTIMSCAHGEKGDLISAGVVYAWMTEKRTGKRVGGLVCEVSGKMTHDALMIELRRSILELHERTYSQYHLGTLNSITRSHRVQKKYGTALVALCFTSFVHPLNPFK